MIGAITGDFTGLAYERASKKSKNFLLFHSASRFTDDSVLSIGRHYPDQAAANCRQLCNSR